MLWEPVAEWARVDSDFDELSPPLLLYCTVLYCVPNSYKRDTDIAIYVYSFMYRYTVLQKTICIE